MANNISVATMPKTTTFQARINPEVKAYVEDLYARNGMTLTDAFNIFLQQSINADGLPFLVTSDNKELLRKQAAAYLVEKAERAISEADRDGWISEEDILKEFEVE